MVQTKGTGIILVLLSALMFGSYGVWSRLLGDSFEPFFQGWTRGFFLTLILLPVLIFTKQMVPIQKADWRWLSIYLVATSLTQAPLFYAFNHLDIGTATLLFFVSMLLTMYLIGFMFLGEKLNRLKAVSFVCACLGLYFVFSFSLTVFALFALMMAILNGIASGSEVGFSKKLSKEYSPLYLSWMSWVIIFVTNGLISLAIGETQHLPSLTMPWAYQFGYSLVSLVGFWVIIQGLKSVEASIGGLIGLLEIIFSLGLGILIFHEGLIPITLLGASIIIVAAALPHLAEFKRYFVTRKESKIVASVAFYDKRSL